MSAELKALIRDAIREELSRNAVRPSAPPVREETVSLASDTQLAAFVRRILAMADDGRARAEIESGRHVFRLGPSEAAPHAHGEVFARPQPIARSTPVSFERGLLGERDVRNLPEGVQIVRLGKLARLTPLAQDELRRKGIKIERTIP